MRVAEKELIEKELYFKKKEIELTKEIEQNKKEKNILIKLFRELIEHAVGIHETASKNATTEDVIFADNFMGLLTNEDLSNLLKFEVIDMGVFLDYNSEDTENTATGEDPFNREDEIF